MTFVNEMYREASCYLDDHPLEDLPYKDNYFDLAVMLNVLDHVQDAKACMRSLIRIVKPGGFSRMVSPLPQISLSLIRANE